MVSAKFSYRTYVPYGTIAIEFASVEFFGNKDTINSLNALKHIIEFYKSKVCSEKISLLRELIFKNNQKTTELKNKIAKIKKQNTVLLFNKEAMAQVKEMKLEIEKINKETCDLANQIIELDNDRYYSVYSLKRKFENMLAHLDFSCKTSFEKGLMTTEIYEYDQYEHVLKEKATKMLNAIEQELEKEIINEKHKILNSIKDKRQQEKEV